VYVRRIAPRSPRNLEAADHIRSTPSQPFPLPKYCHRRQFHFDLD
jgi:hypothetical protein